VREATITTRLFRARKQVAARLDADAPPGGRRDAAGEPARRPVQQRPAGEGKATAPAESSEVVRANE